MNQNDKRLIIDNNISGDHSRKSRRPCHSAILEKECTETVLENHENQRRRSRRKKESQRHSAQNETKYSIPKVSDTYHCRAGSIVQNPQVASAKKVVHRVNVSRSKSLDKIDETVKNTKRHKHSIHRINLQKEDSVLTYRDKDIFRKCKDRHRHKECQNCEKSYPRKEKRNANISQTKRYEKYKHFSSSTSTDSDIKKPTDCKCKNCIHTLKEDHSKRSKYSFVQENDGSARTRVFVPTRRVSYVSKKKSYNDGRKARLKNTGVKSVNNEKSSESKFHNNVESKYNLNNSNGTLNSRKQNKNSIMVNLYPIESNDGSSDNQRVRICGNNADCKIVNNDCATVNENIVKNIFIESEMFPDKIISNSSTSKLPEIKETAVNEQDQSISVVRNDNERKSIEEQNKFESIKSSQRISLENNTDLKKSIYNDASTQYEESTITVGDTKLSDTNGDTLELNDKVYLRCKSIADVIKTLCTLSESQYSAEMKRKSKVYECSRKYGYSKRNEKALRCAMARYIKKIVLSETRHKDKRNNEVKIIIGDNNSKANKIKVMNERSGEVSIICYNVMESVLPIKKKNIVLPRWAESSAGESSGYKSLNNYGPDINGVRTSLELLHKKNMEHDENRVNVKAEVENVKCSSEEDQRNFGAINTSRDFTSKKCSSDMDAQFVNEHTNQRKEANCLLIPVAHARDQCTAEFSNETEQIKREAIAIRKNHTFLNAKYDSNMKCDNDQIAKHNVHPWLRKYIHTPNLQYSVQNDGLLTARKEKESTKEENRCLDALYALWTNMRDGVNSTDDESISSKNSKIPDIPSNKILAQLPRPPVSFLTKFPSFENTDFDFTDGDVSASNEDISRVESTVTTEISILSGTGLSHTDQQTNDSADNIPNQKLCRVSNNTSIYPPPPSFLPIPYSLCCVPKRRGNGSFNDYKEPPPACSVPVPETWKEPSAIKSHSTSFSILRFRKRGKSVNLETSVEVDVNDACRLNRLTKNETKTKKTSRNPFRIFFRRKEDEIDDTNRK